MPQEVENLIEIARIKILCRTANVLKIAQKTDAVVFYLDKYNIKIDEKMINILVEKYGPKLKFSQGVEPYITLKISSKDEIEIIRMIKELLTIIS